MKKIIETDYSGLDRPEILMNLFHPRSEWKQTGGGNGGEDILIPVEDNIVVGARAYLCAKNAPTILFFHGNGEIVSDYDEPAPFYNRNGINFLPVDYRGYGRSTGQPTVTAMMRDCHRIFHFVKEKHAGAGYTGPLILMGRSLGSASALELAFHYSDKMDGLIIESGFAFSGPLLSLLGVDLGAMGLDEKADFENVSKIKTFFKPTLVIHAEHDHIIPFSDGQTLFDACPAHDKTLLKIPGANHNDILARGFSEYMTAVRSLANQIKAPKTS
ncbi:MAG: alpha/beta hydrolase [Deltaproteobacteria bacterium]|nr:alpha/beta hydrolase [Deltaproteobacteria bacterium]